MFGISGRTYEGRAREDEGKQAKQYGIDEVGQGRWEGNNGWRGRVGYTKAKTPHVRDFRIDDKGQGRYDRNYMADEGGPPRWPNLTPLQANASRLFEKRFCIIFTELRHPRNVSPIYVQEQTGTPDINSHLGKRVTFQQLYQMYCHRRDRPRPPAGRAGLNSETSHVEPMCTKIPYLDRNS